MIRHHEATRGAWNVTCYETVEQDGTTSLGPAVMFRREALAVDLAAIEAEAAEMADVLALMRRASR